MRFFRDVQCGSRLKAGRLFVFIACMIAAVVLAGCGTDISQNSSFESTDIMERTPFTDDFTILLGGESIRPNLKNCNPDENEIVLYDGAFASGGVPVLEVKAEKGRTLIGINPERSGNRTEMVIFEMAEGEGERIPVPVNGFVLSVPSSRLEGLRVRKGQSVKTSGSFVFPERETMSFGSFYPDTESAAILERRISLMDPERDVQSYGADKIIYYSDGYSGSHTAVPKDSYLIQLERVTSRSSRIVSISKGDKVQSGESVLVFSGTYNAEYVKNFLKEGMKLFLNHLEHTSGISDSPAIRIGEQVYSFDQSDINRSGIEPNGVYLYNGQYTQLSTPKTELTRRDIVVIDNTIAYIGSENKPIMIPANGGVAISFTGEMADRVKGLSVGDSVQTVQLDSAAVGDHTIRVGSRFFSYDKENTDRVPEGVTVLYTPSFGQSTQTNMYGTEIIVSGGAVQSVEAGKGNAAIPEDGFVLSIHKDAPQYAEAASVTAGETVVTYTSGIGYRLSVGDVSRVNGVRNENMLIVYRDVRSTGTNAYGYEVAVTADGTAAEDGYGGNMTVPEGGYVLSAHGSMVPFLESAYEYGAHVLFRESEMKVCILHSPETSLANAKQTVNEFRTRIDEAKNRLIGLDYGQLDGTVNRIARLVSEAEKGLTESDFDLAASKLSEIEQATGDMTYAFIESHPVENRAMWYRANEKSDEEVARTVEKLKRLNVNALYLETWYNGRFAGFSDNSLIMHTSLNGNYDVLEGFVRICHENGIEVHAWVENFFIGTVEAQESANPALAEHFKGRWLKDQNGEETFYYQSSNTHFIFMNPFEEEVQDLLLTFYEEIIRKYDVDGIHLDYIRFPETNGKATFGYNENIVYAWQKAQKTNVDPATLKSGALYDSWVLFRQDIINGFVKRVSQMIRRQSRRVWLSAAVYPGIPEIKKTIFQDCKNWIDNGYMDEIFSMSYGADTTYVTENARMFARICGDQCFYSTGLMAFSDSPEQALADQMTGVREAGADGVAVFSLGNITPTNYDRPISQGAFRSSSVQVTDLNEAVSEQINMILSKAETLYGPCAGLTDEEIAAVKELLTPIRDSALAFQEDSSSKDRIAYCSRTIELLEDASEKILPLFEGKQKGYAEKDYQDLIHWLTVSRNRESD